MVNSKLELFAYLEGGTSESIFLVLVGDYWTMHALLLLTGQQWYHAPKFLLCHGLTFSYTVCLICIIIMCICLYYNDLWTWLTHYTIFTVPHADTTDVQSASAEVEGDNVTITCTFLSGSNAQGCHVVIRVSSSPTPLWTGNISRDNNSNTVERIETIELPDENNYLVSVHDLEADGSVGQTALSATINAISTITSASQGTSKWSDCVLQ